MVLIKNEYAAVGLYFNEKCILPGRKFFSIDGNVCGKRHNGTLIGTGPPGRWHIGAKAQYGVAKWHYVGAVNFPFAPLHTRRTVVYLNISNADLAACHRNKIRVLRNAQGLAETWGNINNTQ